jgi:hypothetical protein
VIHDAGGDLQLWVDRNGDGDFDDASERRTLGRVGAGPRNGKWFPMAITRWDTDRTIATAASDLFLDLP